MPRMVVFNDPHYSRLAPECRADTYPQDVLAKLHQVARVAKTLKAKTIATTGDLFHRKGKVTFREANDLLAVMSGWRRQGFEVAGILGNHDIAGHSLESMDSRAVGALVHSSAMSLLDRGPLTIQDQEGKIYLTGTSYFHGCDRDDESRVKAYGYPEPDRKDVVHVHLAHGTLLQRGTFFEEYTTAPELIELLAEHEALPDVIVCGHLHFSEGVRHYKRPGSKRKVAVCRVGSLTRVSSDDMDRTPASLLIAVKGTGFLLREVPIKGIKTYQAGEVETQERPEQDERIAKFVQVMCEEADQWALVDHTQVMRRVAEGLEASEEALELAISVVERNQG